MASTADRDFAASAHIDSLTRSFALVPPAAVPPIIDCVLATAPSLSAAQLFSSLVDAFPDRIKVLLREENSKLEPAHSSFILSYVTSLFHLTKDAQTEIDAASLLIWRVIVPLLQLTSESDTELLNRMEKMLCDAVCSWQSWVLMEKTLVPFCLRLVGLHVGMVESDDSAVFCWSKSMDVTLKSHGLNDGDSLPVLFACRLLTSLLDAALRAKECHGVQEIKELALMDKFGIGSFVSKLIWDLSHMVFGMLSQCLEYRSFGIRFFLPSLFQAFTTLPYFEVLIRGLPHALSRKHFSMIIWECCLSLFSLGRLERIDAYNILALYFTFFISAKNHRHTTDKEFDIWGEEEFWVEIQKGLIDREPTVRKLSLYILKISLVDCFGSFGSEDSPGPASDSYPAVRNGRTNISDIGSFFSDMTRRGKWANEEAKSLGVGEIYSFDNHCNGRERWEAFFLLYEMLEEYGTHLVEAAWTHQMQLLLQSAPCNTYKRSDTRNLHEVQMATVEGMFSWLAVLWERGLFHENPQVRCLIMNSFLNIDWENHDNYVKQVPKKFILGPFVQGLNDVAHHKDFGLKGSYTSKTIQGATNFLRQYCHHFSRRARIEFLCCLASVAKQESFGRAGLVALAFCLSSAASEASQKIECKVACIGNNSILVDQVKLVQEEASIHNSSQLLDLLGIVIEKSKQHFNPNYRLQVCEQVLNTASSVIGTCDVPLDVLLHFLSTVPHEFLDFPGPLRRKIREWFSKIIREGHAKASDTEINILTDLCNFPVKFIKHEHSQKYFSFDDDDLNSWVFEAKRWARVFFLVAGSVQHFEPILMFLNDYGTNISNPQTNLDWLPVKFLIVTLRLIEELQNARKSSYSCIKNNGEAAVTEESALGQLSPSTAPIIYEKFCIIILKIAEGLMQFTKSSCMIFWSDQITDDAVLPSSVKGKLGGPSQRRLTSFTAASVLQAILSMETVAGIFSCCIQLNGGAHDQSLLMFLWDFSWKVVLDSKYHSELEAEIRLATYEALVPVLKVLSSSVSPFILDFIKGYNQSIHQGKGDIPLLDPFLLSFLEHINELLANGALTRSRRAVLLNWKWLCLDSLLSIPYNVSQYGVCHSSYLLFSDSTLKRSLVDVVESLENASETSALPMLRSVRLILGLFGSCGITSMLGSFDGACYQVVQQLVESSWILHVNCNKRRVAPIAALLSAVLHPAVFEVPSLHETNTGNKGPLKWFIEQLLAEGTKSPRTIRLVACHLTGLWLSHPKILKYYIKELKLLSLHGSVAFDEDFEGELSENYEAKLEVSCLAQSPFSELSKAFINTEMYARVSVAILFWKLADLASRVRDVALKDDALVASQCGKAFLLELLDSVVNDNDLAKELYKKYSSVHRRKVRAWQMICVLSHYVEEDFVQQVTSMLHICLYRNNLPGVRQYLEMFAIQVYLKFPSLIEEQLIPIFQDYNMRSQALSSYVFIAANVIIHASDVSTQLTHLNELLPPIIPLLTSHHHSLRGFTQVLVYHVLNKLVHALELNNLEALSFERKSFESLRSYLAKNVDCVRLRASMECFFDSFDPIFSSTPAGIFSARNEASEFECVPVSLMEQLVKFLNDVREDLRCSMALDTMTIKNECLRVNADSGIKGGFGSRTIEGLFSDLHMDFQKKVTLDKHEMQPLSADFSAISSILEFPKSLSEMEKEDLLFSQLTHSRVQAMTKLRESRQQFILVASLLDRIPNLAGLARTCEVFRATGLVVANASVVNDKQFQLISVTAEKWIPLVEVPVCSLKVFLEKKRLEGFSILGLEQTANSTPLDQYSFPRKTVLVLGREKEGIPVDIIHILDACVEIPQFGTIRSLNVHVSGAIALWEYTRQQRRNPA